MNFHYMLKKGILSPVIIYNFLYAREKFYLLTTLFLLKLHLSLEYLLLLFINYNWSSSLVLPRYFIAVQKCLGLYSDNGQYSSADVERLSALYESLKKDYARSSAVKVNILYCYFTLSLSCTHKFSSHMKIIPWHWQLYP
jgi:hypothetical protein